MTQHLFNIRFPHDVWEGVRVAAESERRSVHQWVLLAVEDALANKAGELEMDAPGVREAVRAATLERIGRVTPMGMELHAAPPVELAEVSGTLPPTIDALVESGKVQRGSSGVKKRSGLCPHRVPAGSWCKRCEED